MRRIKIVREMTSFQIITLGFFIVILGGSLLLMLPSATRAPGSASFMDSLFTATSAVCVTGLVVHDTATYWTPFGQSVILLLIQIGGMGVITIACFLAMLAGRRIGLFQRNTMQEAIAAPSVGGIVRLTGFILKMSLTVEVVGASLMAPVFIKEFGLSKGLWYAIFHSISAFCNAGFDLMGTREKYSSLTAYTDSPVINLTIAGLIIFGGLGFLTWDDMKRHGYHFRKYRMQSKVIFLMTAGLILFPMLFFWLVEFSSPVWQDMGTGEKLLASFFQAVTPRTAGFNSVDLTRFSEPGILLMIILMLTGGSPGSTAGGMKTTTVAVLILSALSVFRRNEDTNCFGRRLDVTVVKQAAAILFMYLFLFLTGGMVISTLEGLPILSCLFETASAIGTVGLSLGVTPELGSGSRMILILLMYFGRVGGLTLVFAAVRSRKKAPLRLPLDKIAVG